MQVDGPSHPNLDPLVNRTDPSKGGERTEDVGKGTQGSGQTRVTESVRLLHSELSELGDIRQERVHTLQLAIREGNYHRSGEQIAEAMLSELLG